MIGLLAAEVRRMTSRRLFRGFALGIVALIVLNVTVVFFQSKKDGDNGLEEARQEVELCERAKRNAELVGEKTGDWVCPTAEELQEGFDERFVYARAMPDAFVGMSFAMLAFGLVVGASFVGAEFGTGSITTLLTWEPRRGRVLAMKWVAGALVVAAATAAILVLIALVFLPVAMLRGSTAGVDGSFWWTSLGTWARDIGLAVFGATVGMGLATLARSTAGGVGIGFAYGAIADPLLSFWRDQQFEEWTIRYNVARLIGEVSTSVSDTTGGLVPPAMSITRPLILLPLYAAGLMLIAYAVFRRRDVV